MKKTAIISDCGTYRYQLTRQWDEYAPKVMFLMLNPSTADADEDDPTIRRCVNFAKSWGYGGIIVGNLFAYRSTDPGKLINVQNPIGPDNEMHLQMMFREVDRIVTAWGNGYHVNRVFKVFPRYNPLTAAGSKLHYLNLQACGHPMHPLYQKGTLTPKKYTSLETECAPSFLKAALIVNE